ncbi:MAG: bifunctional phosphopantothenoylcysteine decarboxylase/phosphopantothenate--cysteine ligase CoaBC [Blastocatellia bacterium]|nr:bifunctional phosphopantothenoylcysteine decarboxylase/phosphopantothenate--cysteine ligase CoaBC [Blastocatellia bacterium]
MVVKIALGVTGCIGAYKAAQILRTLQELGAEVDVVMTRNALSFIQPLTFQALSGRQVITETSDTNEDSEILHISVAQKIDLLLVAPATANILAKFAHGIADDFLSTLYISTPAPTLIAPAMNVVMWQHPATQENIQKLRHRGVEFIEPESGYLACRMEGKGRLADTDLIAKHAVELATLSQKRRLSSLSPNRDFLGESVLITAGPTREYIDPVRFITNRSSGKMGYALAEAARDRGAKVTLITGPVSLQPPDGITVVNVVTSKDMFDAVHNHIPQSTIIIKAAAVCDYRPNRVAKEKIKKSGETFSLTLEQTDDIVASIGKIKEDRILIGFAAETEKVIEHAEKKLISKNLDLIVANDVKAEGSGFDVDTNRATFITKDGQRQDLPLMTKRELSDQILDRALKIKVLKQESLNKTA